ncbi:NAD-dependent epimerase/dehydratase family protein [Marilutibacter aestuarii]|uniref:NAD(P)-dependent oxidoreductase n=1 Tax=Marilutibacter aestuarii TaxID=1706195 RepID=A0A507ZRB0_9GAMM|nr:NAD-dependent epimerase/dehydratase family protein [Lysobacter aestuarii]TQD39527.1 NAD(P)-dependent oxidoreductase [Lysobacter aestuarii]
MRRALILGGSGQVGEPLLARLRADGWALVAVSREPRAAPAGVAWVRGELDAMPALPAGFEPERLDAIFSAGPLDAFARWYAGNDVRIPRIVAFGSTSVATKHASTQPAERDVARRLREAEATVLARARERGAAATLLRPTLVYGAGRDATLSRIAALARPRGWFPLPSGARGLRQPVHVEDLAAAAVACCDVAACAGQAYDLPGGETVTYREMVARVLASLAPPARCIELPGPLFGLLLGGARLAGMARGLGAAVPRMREDLVFDATPATRDFGYAPRRFAPTAAMFEPVRPPAP